MGPMHVGLFHQLLDVKYVFDCLFAWLLSCLAVVFPERSGTVETIHHVPSRSCEPQSCETQSWQQLGYGYSGALDALRQQQFPQLHGTTYLDHAATTLCSARQLDAAHAELRSQLFINPHSQQQHLSHTRQAEQELRWLTLAMLNADPQQYEVVFTSGATAALKLAGECFPWSPDPHQGRTNTSTTSCSSSSSSSSSSVCYYPVSSHNSLLGVVQLAAAAGARLAPFQVQPDGSCTLLPAPDSSSSTRSSSGSRCSSTRSIGRQQQQQQQEQEQQEGVQEAQGDTAVTHHLVLLPAECNFSGQRLSAAQVTDILQQLQQQAQAQAVSQGSAHAELKPQQEEQPQDSQQQPSMQQQQQQHCGRVDRWVVVLDAAKACTSHPPDLATCPADMVALSYYKIFGHPTGLGALVVKRDLLPELTRRKVYFGGGTVEVSVPQEEWYIRRPGAAGLEDGTLPFTSIAAARHGFTELQQLGGFPAIDRHMACLTLYLALQLYCLRHSNGTRVAELYCSPAAQQLLQQWSLDCDDSANPDSSSSSSSGEHPCAARCKSPNSTTTTTTTTTSSSSSSSGSSQWHRRVPFVPTSAQLAAWQAVQGPVVTFNLRRPDGSWVGYGEVQQLAGAHDILLRTGCFCNPGACAAHLGIPPALMRAHHAAGHVCGDARDLIDGRPTGAVRASLGYMSTWGDVEALLGLVERYFVEEGADGGAAASAAACPMGSPGGVGPAGSGCSTVNSTTSMNSSSSCNSSSTVNSSSGSSSVGQQAVYKGPSDGSSPRVSIVKGPCSGQLHAAAVWVYSFVSALAAATTSCMQCILYVLVVMCEGVRGTWQLSARAAVQAASSSTEVYSTITWSSNPSTASGAQHSTAVHAAAAQSGADASVVDSCTSRKQSAGPHVPGVLSSIYLYPIKSCSAQKVLTWPVGPKGLLFDREWALVNPAGQLLTLKNCPRLTQLQPRVDLEQGVLTVAVAGGSQPPLRLRIPGCSSGHAATAAGRKATQMQEGVARAAVDSCRQPQQQQVQVRVCGDTICSSVLSEVLLPELEGALVPSSAAPAAAADAAGSDDSRDSTCLVTTNRPVSPTISSKAPAHGRTPDSASAAAAGAMEAAHARAPAGAGAGGLSAVKDWFEAAVGVRCRVVQAAAHARIAKLAPAGRKAASCGEAAADVVGGRKADQGSKQQQPQQQLGFANEGQYLLLNLSSLDALLAPQQQQHRQQQQASVGRAEAQDAASTAAVTSSTHQGDTSDPASVLRFRPNLVVSGVPPWAEDSWSAVQIGAVQLQSAGACARCDLVTLHPGTGVREGQGVLRALAGSRRHRGKLNFGVLLSNAAGMHSSTTGCGTDAADSVQALREQQQQVVLQGNHTAEMGSHLPLLRVGDTVQGQL